jgi:hypothetical protein
MDNNGPAMYSSTTTMLPVFEGTAIAIDPHHLLTSAHLFELDALRYNTNVLTLKYKYASSSGDLII